MSVSVLDPETDIMDQFLDPETDIMGERTYIAVIEAPCRSLKTLKSFMGPFFLEKILIV